MDPCQAALRWQRRRDQNSSYWDETCLPKGVVNITHDDDDDEFAEISHQALHVFVALLAKQLHHVIAGLLSRQNIHELNSSSSSSSSSSQSLVSIPVAVAIPEGFYLALAVAAAHTLVRGGSSSQPQFSVVLVPMDPLEGPERLRRILNDAQPLIVLVASACDLEHLQTVAATVTTSEKAQRYYHVFESSQPLYLAPTIHVLDVKNLVSQVEFNKTQLALDSSRQILVEQKEFANANFRHRVHVYEQGISVATAKKSCFLPKDDNAINCISHIVYTSGTTGIPKGCISSIFALDAYLEQKNKIHGVSSSSVVLLASAVSFDPCISDILATLNAGATLFLTTRQDLSGRLHETLTQGRVSHVLCTPTLWSTLAVHATKTDPTHFPDLQVIALGGEPIPLPVIRQWARKNQRDCEAHCRLFATYGVTEACIYQTMGEVFVESSFHVGVPFQGVNIAICQEGRRDNELCLAKEGQVGEIVLSGCQLDAYSTYLRRPELSKKKFCFKSDLGGFCYRTGDRGLVDPKTGHLQVVGRIQGENGMIKYNGVRVELGEIEAAIIDSSKILESVVVDCMVILDETDNVDDSDLTRKSLIGYVVLSHQCLVELGILGKVPPSGVLCSGCFLALLVARCKTKARVTPTAFILIPTIPLTRTGKRNRDAAPSLNDAVPLSALTGPDPSSENEFLLAKYSPLGAFVAEQVVDCLNLLPCQLALLTTSATFTMLGGDSLTATRVVRALYAQHYNVFNGRKLGGLHGVLDNDIFSVTTLLASKNLGAYVDFLQSKQVCQNLVAQGDATSSTAPLIHDFIPLNGNGLPKESHLYDELVQAIMQNKISLALALVEAGAEPNRTSNNKPKFRISNTRGLQERKVVFHSTPLHLAAQKGQPKLVRALVAKHAKFNIPDAVGVFPLHLAASGTHGADYCEIEDQRRLECVQLLLKAGAPLPMKDGNKQSVLHWAARFGYKRILVYFIKAWKDEIIAADPIKFRDSLDWRDRWSRTPVHWAILNDKIDALRILVDHGCSATPVKPKKNARTSAALETPQEMCNRIYGRSPKGVEITQILNNAPC